MLGRLFEEQPDVRRLKSEQAAIKWGIACGELLRSFGNCPVIKAAGLFWASPELFVFETTEERVQGGVG